MILKKKIKNATKFVHLYFFIFVQVGQKFREGGFKSGTPLDTTLLRTYNNAKKKEEKRTRGNQSCQSLLKVILELVDKLHFN